MNRSMRFAAPVLLLAMVLTGCATPAAQPSASAIPAASSTGAAATSSPAPSPTHAPPPTPTAAVVSVCMAGKGEVALNIDGKANLPSAGLDKPIAPGGGGAGVLPDLVELPEGEDRVLEITCTAGEVNCCFGNPDGAAAPGGTKAFKTDIESVGGISGIVTDRALFLAGVFLTDAAPAEPAPERLDQTGETVFDRFAPEIGQTFVIGTGEGSTWIVPKEATRLYLGVMDAYFTHGGSGWYGNNSGWFEVTVRVTTD